MRVHLARLGRMPEDAPVLTLERLAEADRVGEHELSGPDDADLVLFPQCHMLSGDWRLSAIRRHPLVRDCRDRVMVYDERDHPWCGFPGVYVSMPRRHFEDRYQRAWGYLPVQVTPAPRAPDLLFSFVGSPSHACRRPLFDLRHSDAVVEMVTNFTFFDVNSPGYEDRRTRYWEVLGRSRFVLCPRGQGDSSIRLYETLALGRVPVIIADDWVPPEGPDWSRFCLFWPEGRVAGLIEFLQRHDDSWEEMSCAAREAYSKFFAADVWFHRVIELCKAIHHGGLREFPTAGVRNGAFFAAATQAARAKAVNQARSWLLVHSSTTPVYRALRRAYRWYRKAPA